MSLYTEDEAKTKWCPAARVDALMVSPNQKTSGVVAVNRSSDNGHLKGTNCIGSKCMWWRWEANGSPDQIKREVKSVGRIDRAAGGYCGMAGKPE